MARKADELSRYAKSARWLRRNLHRSFLGALVGIHVGLLLMLYDPEMPPPKFPGMHRYDTERGRCNGILKTKEDAAGWIARPGGYMRQWSLPSSWESMRRTAREDENRIDLLEWPPMRHMQLCLPEAVVSWTACSARQAKDAATMDAGRCWDMKSRAKRDILLVINITSKFVSTLCRALSFVSFISFPAAFVIHKYT